MDFAYSSIFILPVIPWKVNKNSCKLLHILKTQMSLNTASFYKKSLCCKELLKAVYGRVIFAFIFVHTR